MSINESVGLQVRRLRESQEMTQLHLSYEAGLSVDHVGKVERGSTSPTVAALARIARGLGVPVVRLLDLHDEGSPNQQPDPLVELMDYLRQRSTEDAAFALATIRQILERNPR